jgi:DNA-binding NtrC family response regulator
VGDVSKQPDKTDELRLMQESMLVLGATLPQRRRLVGALSRRLGLVECADDSDEAVPLMSRCRFDFLLVFENGRPGRWLDWIESLRRQGDFRPVILCSDDLDQYAAAAAIRCGIIDLLSGDCVDADVIEAIGRLRERQSAGAAAAPLQRIVSSDRRPDSLIGESAAMREVKRLVARIAPLPATVLIEGETGTGKELAARLLHSLSGRKGAFVPVNCGAISPELLESELFGHKKGAFTSAHQVREGLFVAARQGTLFLDEVSEMPVALEVKLLRALEEGAVRPVGADAETAVDVRIVASTQHDLSERVRQGRFREDLFYRLNVVNIKLPPLRERAADIVILADFFMQSLAVELGLPAVALDRPTYELLESHDWPGNVRELKNIVERTLMLGEVPRGSLGTRRPAERMAVPEYPIDWTLEQVKCHHMRRVLEAAGGNKSAAARRLGISRKTLERKLGVSEFSD